MRDWLLPVLNRFCIDTDECATDNAGCAQDCVNTDGSFSCGECSCRPVLLFVFSRVLICLHLQACVVLFFLSRVLICLHLQAYVVACSCFCVVLLSRKASLMSLLCASYVVRLCE